MGNSSIEALARSLEERVGMLLLVPLMMLMAAPELEVSLGARTALRPGRAIKQVIVRDPSLVQVVIIDGAVSLEGKKRGVTGVNVTFADGELERVLVLVGDGANSTGMRRERSQAIEVKPAESATAQAKAAPAKPDPKAKERAALHEAADVVRAAVEAL